MHKGLRGDGGAARKVSEVPRRSRGITPLGLMVVFGLLFLLFIVVPLVELYVIVQVASGIGLPVTILLLVTISVIGAWLVRREGTGAMARIREQLNKGKMPSNEIADGALIMFGGTLLLTPGFFTDALGLSLLIPPIRKVIRTVLMKRLDARRIAKQEELKANLGANFGTTFGAGFGAGSPFGRGPVINADVIKVDVHRTEPDLDNPAIEPPEAAAR